MDIVKKNILSIVCGVIAIIAVIAIFYPLSGMYAQMTSEVAKSKSIGDQLASVQKAPRTWPSLSTNEADHVPLKHFPTEQTVQVGTKLTAQWTSEAAEFLNKAIQVQQRNLQLLVPGALPGAPGQTAVAYQFMDEYRKAFDVMNQGTMGNPNNYGNNQQQIVPNVPKRVLNTRLVGTLPPSEADVKNQADTVEAQIRQDMPRYIDGQLTNGPEVEAEVLKRRAEVGDRLRTANALKAMVYLDPTSTFQMNPRIIGNTAPTPDDIFDAQIGLWIQQEICNAVYEANKGSTQGVIDAPIKRLISIRLPTTEYPTISPTAANPGGTPAPAPTDVPVLPANPQTKVPFDYTHNPLGHVSNEFYDVLPFQLTLICEAESVPTVMTDLSRGRYIMFRRVDVQSIDSAVPASQGFIYGSKPTVQLTLSGQYLMLRKVVGPLMPPDVIRGLAAPAAAPMSPDQMQ